jgi:hypothetical protein
MSFVLAPLVTRIEYSDMHNDTNNNFVFIVPIAKYNECIVEH